MSSLTKFIDLLKTINPVFDETKVEISEPRVTEENQNGDNTVVVLKAKPASGYIGNKTVLYTRLDLGRVFSGVSPALDLDADSETDVILKTINDKFGLDLDEDIEILKEARSLTVSAKVNNYKYIGFVKVLLAETLDKVFTTNPDGFSYTSTNYVVDASVYSGNIHNVTSPYIKGIKANSNLSTDLFARVLKHYTNDEWVNKDSVAEYNVNNIKVEKVEYVEEEGKTYQVITLKLDETKSAKIKGSLIFKLPLATTFPLTHYSNYERHKEAIASIPVGTVTEETAEIINKVVGATALKVDASWTVKYNGKVEDIPADLINEVSQNKTNVCIIVNELDPTKEHIVLSYN